MYILAFDITSNTYGGNASTDLVSLEAGDHDGAVRASVRRQACLVEAVEQLERHLPLAAVCAENT